MPRLLYIWKEPYPWEVRIEKICSTMGKNGWEVYLLAVWKDGQEITEDISNFKVIRAGKGYSSKKLIPVSVNPVWRKIINDTIREIKPDIVMPREIMLAEAASDIAHKYDIPSVIDMAENYPAAMKSWKKYNSTFLKRLLVHHLNIPELVEKRSIASSDGVITVCDEQNDRLYETYNFPYEKMQVVHNTPPLDWFDDIKKGYQEPPIVFGHHGHTTSEKNLDVFLKGFLLAAEHNTQIRLVIAGGGHSLDDLKHIASESSSKERIEFTGRYNHEQLKDILSRIDIGVIPYALNGFNNYTIHNKLFDFLASGKPVILSQTKPFIRLIKETGAGINVDCSDPEKIANAILSIGSLDLKTMSQNGLKLAGYKYNWDIDTANLLSFMNNLV